MLSSLHVTSVQSHAFIFRLQLHQVNAYCFLQILKTCLLYVLCTENIAHSTGACNTLHGCFVQVGFWDCDRYGAQADEVDAVGLADGAAINEAEDGQLADKASMMGKSSPVPGGAVSSWNGSHHLCACDVTYPGTQASLLPCKHHHNSHEGRVVTPDCILAQYSAPHFFAARGMPRSPPLHVALYSSCYGFTGRSTLER